MLTIDTIPPAFWYFVMTRSGDGIHGGIGDGADRNAVGKGITQQNMSFHVDRAESWDEERERLTDRQRIRDIEVLLQGDPTRFYVGVLQQQRSHVIWLFVLTLLQAITIMLLVFLVYTVWSAGKDEQAIGAALVALGRIWGMLP